MATTTSTKTGIPSFDAAFEQARESGEQVLSAARKAGNLYLDSYEKAVDRTTELQLELDGPVDSLLVGVEVQVAGLPGGGQHLLAALAELIKGRVERGNAGLG